MAGLPPGSEFEPRGSEHLDEGLLSAYLDGEIEDPDELRRIREHLHGCEACRQMLAELRTVVAMLGQLPAPQPTRSFRLDPGMVSPRLIVSNPWYIRFQPAMRRLTALAALLLVVVVAADLVTSTMTGSESRETAVRVQSSAPAPMAAGGAAQESAQATTSTSGGSTSGNAGSAAGAAAPTAAAARSVADQAATPVSTTATSGVAATSSGAAATPMPGTAAAPALATEAPGAQPAAGEAAGAPEHVSASEEGSSSIWRLAELGLVIIILWLLVLTVAVPRLRPARPRPRPRSRG